ncbi:MAG: MMPL family transporter [Gammaproteobacteria bacterium]|nr:MMPL family transporter [Gammaproteobacteria bacterium]
MSDKSTSKFSQSYARFVIKYRWPLMLILLVATIINALQIKNLDMRNDPDTLLPPTNKYVATNSYAEKNYGMGNIMVIALRIEEGDIYQSWFINKVQEIHNKLEALPHSRGPNFINVAAKKIKYMSTDENGMVFKRLMPTSGISSDPEKAKEQLAFLEEGILTNPVMGPMLVGYEDKDGNKCDFKDWDTNGCTAKSAFIIGDYTDEVKEVYVPWVRQVRDIMQENGGDDRYELLVAGEPYFLAWMMAELYDKWWLFVISIIIVIAALWFEFRNWRGAFFPIIGVSATIALTLGLMGFTAFKLTTMMVLTPMLLLAIGVGHSVQVTRRFIQEDEKHRDAKKSAEIAISATIVPATLSIVTDMVGFATLATVDISFYKAYAYFGMYGMLTLLFTTTTLIPLLMMTFPPRCSDEDVQESVESHGWEHAVGGFLTKVVSGPLKWIPIAFVVLVLAVSTHYTKVLEPTEEDIMPGVEKGINYARAAFKGESDTIQQLLTLNKIMPGVISVSIPIRGKEPVKPICTGYDENDNLTPPGCHDPDEMGAQGIFNDAEVLADMAKLEEWMQAHPFIGFTGSYAQYIRLVNMLMTTEPGDKPSLEDLVIPSKESLTKDDPEDARIPTEVVQMYNGLLETMTDDGDMDTFVSKNWNEGVVLGFVNTMDPVETHQVTRDIQNYLEEHKNDPGFKKVNFGLRNGDTSGDTNELSQAGENYELPGVGGFLGATEATRDVAVENWLSGPMLTALAIFLFVLITTKSIGAAGILIFILMITLFSQYGMGGYFTSVKNWSGNLAFHLQVALSIAMGLGVDYGIYMLVRLREEMIETGQNWQQSLRNTLDSTGSAIIISVIVLLGCFIPLLNTDLANTWGLGVYIMEALVIDVVTALTILPLLVLIFKPKYIFSGKS